jgi:predicted DNA-binding transcriptional regulator YafY
MNDTLLRQWEMLRLVPRLPGKISTSELQTKLDAGGYEINLRTIQRDLNNLSRVLPLTSDEGRPQGWSWRRDAPQIDLPTLGLQAALVFKLVEAHLQRLLPRSTLYYLAPWFQTATGVLDNHGNGLAAWPGKIRVLSRGLPQQPPVIDAVVQAAIYQGLLQERRLAVTYQPPWFEGTKDYVVNPLALVVRDGLVYLVCTMWDYGDVRHLLLHRMLSAELMEEAAPGLDGFDLDAHIAQGEFSYPVEPDALLLVAEFFDHGATSVAECPLSPDQTLEELEDGGLLVRATVPDTLELRAWLMGFGDAVTVREPLSLRAEFAETATRLANRYGETS